MRIKERKKYKTVTLKEFLEGKELPEEFSPTEYFNSQHPIRIYMQNKAGGLLSQLITGE